MKRYFFLTGGFMLTFIFIFLATFRPAPAADMPVLDYERVVVKAYYSDPALLDTIPDLSAAWEIDHNKQFVVLEVDIDQYLALERAGFDLVIETDLTEQLNRPLVALPGQEDGIPGFPCYRTVEETFATAAAIATTMPHLAEWIDAGDSWEKTQGLGGYDMMVLRLTNENINGPKPKLFMTSAIHAREYATAELNTRFAEYLVDNYGSNADATWLLDHHEIHLMLQTNPDGRKQAETGLSWRKNVNNNFCSDSNSRGVDLNRNFAFQWGCCGGSSGSECNILYRGPSPASEPETQAVQNYIVSEYPDLRDPDINAAAPLTTTGIYVDVHSFSELVIWPWGFGDVETGNATEMTTLGRKLAYFNDYTPEQAIELYPTDGTTDDYAYGEVGLPAYTFELGTSFFQACGVFENEILPDNLEALVYAAKAVREPYIAPAGPDAGALAVSAVPVSQGDVFTLTAVLDDTRFNNSNGTEPTQNIAAAEYYIDVPPWLTDTTPIALPMLAQDGNFNSSVEDSFAVIDSGSLTEGQHMLYVRGQDDNGTWGVFSAIFIYVVDPLVAPVLGGEITAVDSDLPLAASITANDIFQTQSDPGTGLYQMQVISDTYEMTAVPDNPNYAAATVTGVVAQNGQTVQQDFQLFPYCDLFGDDVESGNIGWTTQAPWTITDEDANSPTHSWTESPGGNYGSNRNVSLTSPVFDLSEYDNIALNYWQICDTEAGYDYCHVEISPDGTNWDEIATFDGPQNQWEEVTLDLSPLAGAGSGQIRFRFTSDSFIEADGWHIDDIRLRGTGLLCLEDVPPSASFSSTSPDALGETTLFSNNSVGSDLTYSWDFGDGSVITETANPTHLYGTTGSFTVTLTATNKLGSDVAIGIVDILEAPSAAFDAPLLAGVGQPVQFTNLSTGTNLAYLWDFDDGETSTLSEPAHVFDTIGSYTVSLTAANLVGSDMADLTLEIVADTLPYKVYVPAVLTMPAE